MPSFSSDKAPSDKVQYLEKKEFYRQLLTIYGRKPVLEALQDSNINFFKLHLADSNKSGAILEQIIALAKKRHVDINYHAKRDLAHISKNSKQDQGVAADLICPGYTDYQNFIATTQHNVPIFIALDNITNPQNLGMIIRSVCASPINGLILPKQGCAKLDPLVIKASAGTIFKANILRCTKLLDCLNDLKQQDYQIIGLSGQGQDKFQNISKDHKTVFVVGNESYGISQEIMDICDKLARIPMCNGVESLNVSIVTALIAFRGML